MSKLSDPIETAPSVEWRNELFQDGMPLRSILVRHSQCQNAIAPGMQLDIHPQGHKIVMFRSDSHSYTLATTSLQPGSDGISNLHHVSAGIPYEGAACA